MKKRKIERVAVKPVISIILIVIIVVLSLMLIRVFLKTHPHFIIDRVVILGVGESYAELGKKLIGSNIFSVDLKFLKDEIQEWAADIECVSIKRKFPNEMMLTLRKRMPIAQLKLSRFYPIDQSGMIIGKPSDLALEDLPVIFGLDGKIPKPKIAQTYFLPEIKFVSELIDIKNKSTSLKGYRLIRIVFDKSAEPSFFIVDNFADAKNLKNTIHKPKLQTEIKVYMNDLAQAIKVLGLVLESRGAALDNIEYIDLRNPNSPVFLDKNSKS